MFQNLKRQTPTATSTRSYFYDIKMQKKKKNNSHILTSDYSAHQFFIVRCIQTHLNHSAMAEAFPPAEARKPSEAVIQRRKKKCKQLKAEQALDGEEPPTKTVETHSATCATRDWYGSDAEDSDIDDDTGIPWRPKIYSELMDILFHPTNPQLHPDWVPDMTDPLPKYSLRIRRHLLTPGEKKRQRKMVLQGFKPWDTDCKVFDFIRTNPYILAPENICGGKCMEFIQRVVNGGVCQEAMDSRIITSNLNNYHKEFLVKGIACAIDHFSYGFDRTNNAIRRSYPTIQARMDAIYEMEDGPAKRDAIHFFNKTVEMMIDFAFKHIIKKHDVITEHAVRNANFLHWKEYNLQSQCKHPLWSNKFVKQRHIGRNLRNMCKGHEINMALTMSLLFPGIYQQVCTTKFRKRHKLMPDQKPEEMFTEIGTEAYYTDVRL